MFTAIKAYVVGAKFAIVAIAAGVLLSALGVQTWRLHSLQASSAEDRVAYADRVALAETRAREASEKNRQLETTMAAQAAEKNNELDTAREDSRRQSAAWTAERERLRDSLSAYATGRGLTPKVAADTCSARSAALGSGLESTLRTEEELVNQLEQQRADTRRLLQDARSVRGVLQ